MIAAPKTFAVVRQVNDDLKRSKRNPSVLLPLLLTRNRSIWTMDMLMSLNLLDGPILYKTLTRVQCVANVQRLAHAMLLYERNHGKLPDGDWREAVKPYLGANPEQCFRCLGNELAEDETVYALVIGESESSATIPFLIVETATPQKLGKGDGRIDLKTTDDLASLHDGYLVCPRSGAVHLLPRDATKLEELRALLE